MKRSVSYKSKEQCCGCTACMSVCPKDAITMQPDALGFKYPVVNENLCISCGLCDNVCDFLPRSKEFERPNVFAVRSKSDIDLFRSQSGGAFALLSDAILDAGGVVYGVAFDRKFRIVHKRAENKEERDAFRLSKYVQSDLENIFLQVFDDLHNGRTVLFSGTTCQVAGLESFCKRIKTGQLYTVDIICHSTPSPALWESYIAYLQEKYGQIEQACFRDKSFGWSKPKESYKFAGNTKKHSRKTFLHFFYSQLCVRYSCYDCPFTNFNRPSDITIGDFWGNSDMLQRFPDDKGISLVLVNTKKGEALFNKIKQRCFIVPSDTDHCIQAQFLHPVRKPVAREQFEKDFLQYGFLYVAKKYSDMNFRSKVKAILRPAINALKALIKR